MPAVEHSGQTQLRSNTEIVGWVAWSWISRLRQTLILREYLVVLLILLLSFVVRVLDMDGPSIWIDEVISYQRASMRLSQMIEQLVFDHVPLYYCLLHLWVKIAGSSIFALRFPSALFGTLVVGQMYVLGRILFDSRTGRISAFVSALSPFLVTYARMARPYPLLWMLTLQAMLFFLYGLRKGRTVYWAGFAVASIAALYTHFTALLFIGSLDLACILMQIRKRTKSLVPWLMAHLAIAIAYLPLISKLYQLVIGNALRSSESWRAPLTPGTLARVFLEWSLGSPLFFESGRISFLISCVTFGVLVLGSVATVRKRYSLREFGRFGRLSRVHIRLQLGFSELLILGILAIPLSLAVGVKLVHPNRLDFGSRTISLLSFPYYLLLARGAVRFRPKLAQELLAGTCTVCLLMGLVASRDLNAGVDWRSVSQYIQSNERQGDVVLVNPSNYLAALEFYYGGNGEAAGVVFDASDPTSQSDAPTYLKVAAGFNRVWMITINDFYYDPQDQIRFWLERYCVIEDQKQLIPGHAQLRLFGQCSWEE